MMISGGRLIRDDAPSQLVATGTVTKYTVMTRQRGITQN
jgi:hypothetical protein